MNAANSSSKKVDSSEESAVNDITKVSELDQELSLDKADDILNSVKKLEKELHLLNSHKFIKVQNSLFKLIQFQFLKGVALGFGSVVGATLFVSFLVYLASTIEFVPIIGEWVNQIMSEITMPGHTPSDDQQP